MISDRIEAFLADKGYDADAIREEIADADIEAVIPAKSNRREPVPHDKAKYIWRNQIERLFNKLKNWRRVATATTRPRYLTSASSPSQQSNYGYPLSTSAIYLRTVRIKHNYILAVVFMLQTDDISRVYICETS
ncbi:transposase [Phyllobacterium salinisoli]|uniref:transposase n=1 Tax=Phyllobacterium salinisoli TaxID=1899321 RepID=UPI0026C21EA4